MKDNLPYCLPSTDCSTAQRQVPPLLCLALNSEDTRNTFFICPASIPEGNLASHQSSSPPQLPSTARNADSQLTVKSNGVSESPIKVTVDHKNILTLSRNTSPPPASPAEQTVPSKCIQEPPTYRTHPSMECISNQRGTLETPADKTNEEFKSDPRMESPAAAVSPRTPAVPSPRNAQVRRTLFTDASSHTPVRRTKSEGHVLVALASARQAQSTVPQLCTDATKHDRLWTKLEPGSHRDSMSSSSSISSSDTVIDLSMPNLARKSLATASGACEPQRVSCHHSASVSYDTMRFSKSKSNPNLQQSVCPNDELQPRPLRPPQESDTDLPSRMTQRRHTWSRLYMEGLKQSSASRPSAAATTPMAASMSKSLGDLTSEDISCNFVSKYRSISRSFIMRPTRDQLRKGSPQKARPTSDLTAQLRKLTDVEPLNASDFAPENKPRESQEEIVDETLVRRTSSRSQSRVRYIANRAKKAQERQRLQGLVQGRSSSFSFTGSFGSGSSGSPIEERGNPEGACCIAPSPCTSLDLHGQVGPLGTPSPRQSHSSTDPENSEVFFMLKL